MGMDGAGKSTVIFELEKWLRQRGVKTKVLHTHDYHVAPLNKINALGRESFIRRFHYLFYLWPLAALIDHRATFRRNFAGGDSLILTDRYFYDKYVRFRFWKIAIPGLFTLYKWLLPQPWRIILLDVPTEIAVRRKGEYSPADYDVFRREYLRFAKLMGPSVVIVDASAPLAEVLDCVKGCFEMDSKELSFASQ